MVLKQAILRTHSSSEFSDIPIRKVINNKIIVCIYLDSNVILTIFAMQALFCFVKCMDFKIYNNMAYDVNEIAKKIIAKVDIDAGDVITNLKLQKLLYYVQGFYLAVFDKPLYDDEIEAWMYGPVVPSVYDYYASQGKSPLYNDDSYTPISLAEEEEDLFNQVYDAYGQFSAVKLMNLTHEETPWKSTEIGKGNIISKKILKDYFKTRLND